MRAAIDACYIRNLDLTPENGACLVPGIRKLCILCALRLRVLGGRIASVATVLWLMKCWKRVSTPTLEDAKRPDVIR